MVAMTLLDLFGGAIRMELPSNFIDASDLRQIPDTQEVFLDRESDISVIVEVLQQVDAENAAEAVKFHFDSLAHDNSAISQQIHSILLPSVTQMVPCPPETPTPIVLHGEQKVQKFNLLTSDLVHIFVALYRIEAKGADVVLTTNVPLSTEELLAKAKEVFDNAVGSLKIVDFDLFA